MKSNCTLVLSDNETIVNDWNYASTSGGYTSDHSLIVTNKRIIADSKAKMKNGETVSRQEIKVKDVSGVSLNAGRQSFLAVALFFMLLGVALSVLGFVSSGGGAPQYPLIALGALLFIAGIIFLFKRKNMLTVEITVNGEMRKAFGFYANAGPTLKASKKKVKVKVNEAVADEIVATLGSVLLCD